MPKCGNCGHDIRQDHKVCPNCGVMFQSEQSNSQDTFSFSNNVVTHIISPKLNKIVLGYAIISIIGVFAAIIIPKPSNYIELNFLSSILMIIVWAIVSYSLLTVTGSDYRLPSLSIISLGLIKLTTELMYVVVYDPLNYTIVDGLDAILVIYYTRNFYFYPTIGVVSFLPQVGEYIMYLHGPALIMLGGILFYNNS